jgi:hypothetical protein
MRNFQKLDILVLFALGENGRISVRRAFACTDRKGDSLQNVVHRFVWLGQHHVCCSAAWRQVIKGCRPVVISPTPQQGPDRTRRRSLNSKVGGRRRHDIRVFLLPASLLRRTALFSKSREDATQDPLTKSLDFSGIEKLAISQPDEDNCLPFLTFLNSTGSVLLWDGGEEQPQCRSLYETGWHPGLKTPRNIATCQAGKWHASNGEKVKNGALHPPWCRLGVSMAESFLGLKVSARHFPSPLLRNQISLRIAQKPPSPDIK